MSLHCIMVNVNWSIIEVMHCLVVAVVERQDWGQELSVISGSKYIDKLVGQTMR